MKSRDGFLTKVEFVGSWYRIREGFLADVGDLIVIGMGNLDASFRWVRFPTQVRIRFVTSIKGPLR